MYYDNTPRRTAGMAHGTARATAHEHERGDTPVTNRLTVTHDATRQYRQVASLVDTTVNLCQLTYILCTLYSK